MLYSEFGEIDSADRRELDSQAAILFASQAEVLTSRTFYILPLQRQMQTQIDSFSFKKHENETTAKNYDTPGSRIKL